ncbi:uncharacterized protein [Musca autumnalis]|uniref:uncharacterized protein n=1 Tax=Musca autumnalis TaxID=221902 RepID=UPI003CFABBD3
MNYNTRSKQRNKRGRPETFDFNRSVYYPSTRKQRRIGIGDEMAESNPNMTPYQFIDLADSIIRRENNNMPNGGSNPVMNESGELLNSEVRSLVHEEAASVQKSLEDKVKSLVQNEMSEVRKMIDSLTRGMKDLSEVVRAQTGSTATVNQPISNPEMVNSAPMQMPSNEDNPITTFTNSQQTSNRATFSSAPIQVPANRDNPTMINTNSQLTSNPAMVNSVPIQMPTTSRNPLMTYINGLPIIQYPSTNPTPAVNQGIVPVNAPMNELLRTRVDKLGLNFSGDPKDLRVADFVYRLEIMREQYGIPWAEVLRDFSFLVSGQAREWYWLYRRNNIGTDWEGLKLALLSQYQTPQSKFDLLRELLERKQRYNEPVNAYFHEMGILRSRLMQPVSDNDMIKILKGNIREDIKRHVYQMTISSVEQLRIECIDAERNFPRRETKPMTVPQRPNRQVNEIYEEEQCINIEGDDILAEDNISAIRFQQQAKPQIKCWNCRENGHLFMDCPAEYRKLFCYKCGKPDTVTPKCPNCRQGNHRRGVENTGDPRPAENPATQN